MGYEIKYIYHPRKEEGSGYDTEVKEEKFAKVGKPFDDTSLEKCAAAIMAQLARRDIWVIDVEVSELVKNAISFKEAKDGKGILLKNKRFSLNSTAQLVAEEENVVHEQQALPAPPPHNNVHPHANLQEAAKPAALTRSQESLYTADPNKSLAVKNSFDPRKIDRNKRLYEVYYEPYMYQAEANSLRLKFTEDKKYPVHQVIPSPTGKLNQQQIAVSDDTGQVMILDEKFFTTAGRGLVGDDEVGFSEQRQSKPKRKLLYEDQLTIDGTTASGSQQGAIPTDIPVDNGAIPGGMVDIPDLRPGQKF